MIKIKKRIKQFTSICLAIVILLTVCIMPVNAAEAPSSITVKRTKVMESYIGDNNGFTAYATNDGVIVYCMELIKKGATTGTNYSFLENADAGLLYIIENGYPNKTITNRDEIDQYITQSAVWWYLDDITGAGNLSVAFQTTDREAYAGIRDEIKKLVNNAKAAKEQAKPSMDVSIDNGSLTLTNDKKYYESNYITVSLTGASEYKVSLNNDKAKAVNENGDEKTTFKAGEKFKVIIPAQNVKDDIDLNIKVTATGSIKYAATYNPENSEFQKIVSAKVYTKDINLENTLKLSTTIEDKPICKIEDGKYYGKNGTEVDEKTYNEECSSETISVPNTSANASLIILGIGAVLVIAGASLIIYRYRLNKN